jgi:hypothetical protein
MIIQFLDYFFLKDAQKRKRKRKKAFEMMRNAVSDDDTLMIGKNICLDLRYVERVSIKRGCRAKIIIHTAMRESPMRKTGSVKKSIIRHLRGILY